MSLDPATAVGAVRLRVADPQGMAAFYERAIGLRALERADGAVRLGPDGGAPLVELEPAPDAPGRPAGTTGLFHLAILVPSRPQLARALRRVADAGWSLTGASDHLVSEALYLRDPEGNGIEIYRDRPRDRWRRDASGRIAMATLPLDLDAILAELPAGADGGMPAGTRIGHVHLQVARLEPAGEFYERTLGLDVTVGDFPGALFLSAGGYHHHVGLNVWETRGAPSSPRGALGLAWFELRLAGDEELDGAEQRLRGAGVPVERRPDGLLAADPDGNCVLLAGPRRPSAP